MQDTMTPVQGIPIEVVPEKNPRRPKRLQGRGPDLNIPQILEWADEHRRRTGRWPKRSSGKILGTLSETWQAVHQALRRGGRGLPERSSLPRLLADHRGVPIHLDRPRLAEEMILRWADLHHQRTKTWPTDRSGVLFDDPSENWHLLNVALIQGVRGLPGDSSLARLLAQHRGVRNRKGAATIPDREGPGVGRRFSSSRGSLANQRRRTHY